MKISQAVWALRLPRVRVPPESLARFMVMEGIETPSPGARAFLASIEAQTNKPE